jgi:hypothetical protein
MPILHCIRIDRPHPSRTVTVPVSEHDLISKVQELVFPHIDWEDGDPEMLPLYKSSFRIPIDDEDEFENVFKDKKLQRLITIFPVRQCMISGPNEEQISIVVGGM